MGERMAEEVGVAAVNDKALRENLKDAAADQAAALNERGADLLAVQRLGGGGDSEEKEAEEEKAGAGGGRQKEVISNQ